MTDQGKVYFTPGPAKMPVEVMDKIHGELRNFRNLEQSVLEMSHRSKEFDEVLAETEQDLRNLLRIPDNYSVLFMQGGARSQFDAVPLNLCAQLDNHSADYIVTGSWSKMAATDAGKYVTVHKQQVDGNEFKRELKHNELTDKHNVSYRFYCDNETIHGVEFSYVPEHLSKQVPLVCDMTSNFLTRPVDVSKYGIIFASTQKNAGISGLCIVIIRKDLVGNQMNICPTLMNYKVMQDNKSVPNTAPTFAIYIAGLCFKWILKHGGLEEMDKFCRKKANILYDLIDNSNNFYICPVEKTSRSRTNVVFVLENKELDSKFLSESKDANLFELKGHRSVGGFRASLYHGVTEDNVKRLAKFMDDFRRKYS